MLKNYLVVALRTFRHNKTFSLINIVGLAIGISAALVIYLIVQYDFSFDKFEKDGSRIYRVVSDFKFAGETFHNSGVPDPMGDVVKKEVAGVETTVAFHQPNFDVNVRVPSSNPLKPSIFKKQTDIIFADQDYFSLLTYQWISGSSKTAFKEPFAIVLSDSRAKAYFPGLSTSAMIGKVITYNDSINLTVTGVVKELDQNSDFIFKEFVSLNTIKNTGLKNNYSFDEWGNTNSSSQLYIKLSPSHTVAQTEKQLAGIMKKYNKDQKQDSRNSAAFTLQPLSDVHFNSDYGNYGEHLAHKPTLYGLLVCGSFLLLLGCVNFINLATAQASQRAKEIGIRKTMGSSKTQLISQFMSETFLITFIATILSIILTPLLLKVFGDFIPKDLHFNLLHQPGLILFLVGLIIAVTVLAGSYPSLVLSRFNPALVLKNQAFANSGKSRKTWIRKTLTISQFIIAQFFIMATLVVSKQIHFTLTKDLGFRKDAIVYFHTSYYDANKQKRSILMEKLKAMPGIKSVSLSNSPPSSGNTNSSTVKYSDGKKEIETDVQIKFADTNYIRLYQVKLVAGVNYPYSDTANNVVINETYAHILGFKDLQQAVGKIIKWNNRQVPITGVVADFNQRSLHEVIKPLMITSEFSNEYCINVLLQPQDATGTAWKKTIGDIEKSWKGLYPDDDFQSNFYDESIAKFYKSEQDIAGLLKWSTGLAIFISCLGLLGLVIYTTNLRMKEIGVRKVLGASISQILSILSKEFVVLVFIAFVIATPLAWWVTHKWIENYAYKTTISWWIFLLSGVLMTLIALITLSFQTIRAASANPIKSLRTE